MYKYIAQKINISLTEQINKNYNQNIAGCCEGSKLFRDSSKLVPKYILNTIGNTPSLRRRV